LRRIKYGICSCANEEEKRKEKKRKKNKISVLENLKKKLKRSKSS
jgi:hypothetical protein